jgi:hypothetical protein
VLRPYLPSGSCRPKSRPSKVKGRVLGAAVCPAARLRAGCRTSDDPCGRKSLNPTNNAQNRVGAASPASHLQDRGCSQLASADLSRRRTSGLAARERSGGAARQGCHLGASGAGRLRSLARDSAHEGPVFNANTHRWSLPLMLIMETTPSNNSDLADYAGEGQVSQT